MRLSLLMVLVSACSANDDFPSPVLASVEPDHGPPGSTVLITGDYFCGHPADFDDVDPLACDVIGFVQFGATTATPTQYTDRAITVEVPAGLAGTARVVLTVAGRISNAIAFTID